MQRKEDEYSIISVCAIVKKDDEQEKHLLLNMEIRIYLQTEVEE